MALDSAPLLWRVRKFGFALETTTGTKATIANTDCVTRCFNSMITYDTERVDRPTNDIVPRGGRRGKRPATVTLGTEVYGGATLPHMVKLLRGCGFSDAGTAGLFVPIQGATQTLTFAQFRKGRTRYALGCMGTAVITLTAGQPARADWTFTGKQDREASTAAPSPITHQDTNPLIVGALNLAFGTGPRLTIPEIQIDLGNVVIVRDDVEGVDSSGDPTGIRAAYITDVAPRVRISPEALSYADRNWIQLFREYTDVEFSTTLTDASDADNTLTISAPAMQIDEQPEESEDQGLVRDNIVFVPTGDNYLSFDFNPQD